MRFFHRHPRLPLQKIETTRQILLSFSPFTHPEKILSTKEITQNETPNPQRHLPPIRRSSPSRRHSSPSQKHQRPKRLSRHPHSPFGPLTRPLHHRLCRHHPPLAQKTQNRTGRVPRKSPLPPISRKPQPAKAELETPARPKSSLRRSLRRNAHTCEPLLP